MTRPTKIQVNKSQDGYEIACVDEMTGSAVGISLPIEGYEALRHHFKTGKIEVSSDELNEIVECNCYPDKLKHVIDNNAYPYGLDYEYDKCTICGKTYNFNVK